MWTECGKRTILIVCHRHGWIQYIYRCAHVEHVQCNDAAVYKATQLARIGWERGKSIISISIAESLLFAGNSLSTAHATWLSTKCYHHVQVIRTYTVYHCQNQFLQLQIRLIFIVFCMAFLVVLSRKKLTVQSRFDFVVHFQNYGLFIDKSHQWFYLLAMECFSFIKNNTKLNRSAIWYDSPHIACIACGVCMWMCAVDSKRVHLRRI